MVAVELVSVVVAVVVVVVVVVAVVVEHCQVEGFVVGFGEYFVHDVLMLWTIVFLG